MATEAVLQELNAYEQERKLNIARNERFLLSLGLDQPVIPHVSNPPKTSRKRKSNEDPDYSPPERRSARVSQNQKQSAALRRDDDDVSDGEEDFTQTFRKRPKKLQDVKSVAAAHDQGCIVVAPAKTGRSKCRRCLEPLAVLEPRVGMESWMVGRQVMVWQHPSCFCSGLHVTVEATGRTKCKHTKQTFQVGERRLSATAHTSTAHIKLSAAPWLLRPVFAALPKAELWRITSLSGIEQLASEELQAFEEGMAAKTDALPSLEAQPAHDASDAEAVKAEPKLERRKIKAKGASKEKKQPPAGTVAKAKGTVCWMFAGKQCYGELLPGRETATTCYARTQKGNTKTLAKGGAYWWMLS